MEVTYLITYKEQKLIYVFDLDGVCSYAYPERNSLQQFSADVFEAKSRFAQQMFMKPDYATMSMYLLKRLYSIAIQDSSENLLNYLRNFRDEFIKDGIDLKLKKHTGLIESEYNNEKRVTKEKAEKELRDIARYC